MKALAIDLIEIGGGTQIRSEIDLDHVRDLKAAWEAKAEVPPVVVFFDGKQYWLADGFHRFHSAKEAKRGSIPADVRQGTQRDAILFACGANVGHGLRRTNADKRNAVNRLLGDEEWVKWSDRKIADAAAVGVDLVGVVRKQLSETDSSSPAAKSNGQPRVGIDGKARKQPAPKAAKISGGTTFDVSEIESKGKPKNGAVKKGFDDKTVTEAFRLLVRGIDDLYDDVLNLYHDRKELVGGAGYGKAVAVVKESLNASHDAANVALHAFKEWAK